ncbi:aminotransferase, class V [Ancylostoma caninum]|uniref:Aminotransferase, class V n=1 Tax=Ancylostoma caninum TaxID=29170 RepID=A0A368H2Q6_ANCCA|nr:aminotransferase, class V [Ancylostoma caninum]
MQRLFGERVPEIEGAASPKTPPTSADLLPWIRDNEIGQDAVIETPFGRRQAIYCDYTASARAIRPIEDYILDNVLPLYGNTHSSVTVTSEQTTLFVHEARQEIRAMTGAGDGDSVIFTGAGSTAAVELLVHLMQPESLVVIHSIHEHHSNLLPWRSVAEACYCIREAEDGTIDLDDLLRVLEAARTAHPHSQLLAAFTACSNITGICVLVVKKSIIRTANPKRIGGGTVFFVSQTGEWYLKDAEYREEGGTPDSVGIIRLALAVKLKRAVGEHNISMLERKKSERFLKGLENSPNVVLLGSPSVRNRLAVFSFLIKDTVSGLFFHHNYVSALLNDLFGIQSRAGCMCAGPYAQYLMGIDEEVALQYLAALRESEGLDRTHLRRVGEYSPHEMLRPGFTRVSIPYFWTDEQVDHLVECIRFVSERAADFIHLYQLNCESAEWHHHKQRTFHARKWLGYVSFTATGMKVEEKKRNASDPVLPSRSIGEAHRLANESLEALEGAVIPDGRSAIEDRHAHLRWFVLPIEVAERTRGIAVNYPKAPFHPRTYSLVPEQTEDDHGARIEMLQKDVGGPTNGHAKHEDPEALIEPENGHEKDAVEQFDPCSSGDCIPAPDTPQCPLDPADRGKGQMGDLGTDEEPESAKMLDDWDRRVVVRRRELVPAEEANLPWRKPPLEMYRRVTEAIHGLQMIKAVFMFAHRRRQGLGLFVRRKRFTVFAAYFTLLSNEMSEEQKVRDADTNFELGAITVDPGSSAYNPRPLIDYCRSLNIDYFYEEQDIIGTARKLENLRSICAFCSRMKRGRLAAAAQHHGWNVLAMGQHLDDVAERCVEGIFSFF